MRLSIVFLLLAILCSSAFVAAWSEKDHEIFRLKEELEKHEGKGTTFYSFLELETGPGSTSDQITKAYRKRSRQLHPDKNPSKEATDRFARLGLIANILRGAEKDRYDFFLQKGFPRWKGTGYYYARFRPGLFTVIIFLYLISSGAHYVILNITANNERARMQRYISECKAQAWPNGFPPADSSKRKIMYENGKVFMVYPDGTVWIVDSESNEEYLLDVNEVELATWRKTILFRLPIWLWDISIGRYIKFPAKGEPNGNAKKSRQPKTTNGTEEPAKRSVQGGVKKKVLDDGKVVGEASNVAGGRRRRRK
ncbi:hypothetical protein V1517DRAFT_318326 [Lipomyces orientalis]|uniref:Uncharacterized protein n=1 Tax=Lipomyces orientalis TaxID=1233043 RepID=A0ACC3TTC7_9ASCO